MRRDVKIEPFMEDHMVCVVPPGHEWADDDVDIADLRHAVLVTRELGSGSRRIVEQALEEAGLPIKELHLGMTFDSTEGLLSAVEAGLGIAFVSRWAVRNQLALGTLRLARVRGLKLGQNVFHRHPRRPRRHRHRRSLSPLRHGTRRSARPTRLNAQQEEQLKAGRRRAARRAFRWKHRALAR